MLISISDFAYSQNYNVSICIEDDDIYIINYGSFYVRLYAYKYPYGEDVLLKCNGYSGKICWKEEEYNFYTDLNEINYDYYMICDTYIEKSCSGCLTKNGELIDSILTPVDLSEVID